MEKKFDIAKYIESVGRKLVSEFEDARELGADPNAKGAGIESATRRQLKLLLPDFTDVGQGYIIDSYGNISKQIDLVIFERSFCPVFSVNDTPESTYYPCEGVVAAIEIKSKTRKQEFMDSCVKAISVRNLKRRFNVEEDGSARNIRRYGDLGRYAHDTGVIVPYGIAVDKNQYAHILTVLMTGEVNVSPNTVHSYYDEMQCNAPDIFVSLDGIFGVFETEDRIVTNARLGSRIMVANRYKNPFSVFIHLLYRWLYHGHTVGFETYQNYFDLPRLQ